MHIAISISFPRLIHMHYPLLDVDCGVFVFRFSRSLCHRPSSDTNILLYSKNNCIQPLALNIASHHSHRTKIWVIIIHIKSILQATAFNAFAASRCSIFGAFFFSSYLSRCLRCVEQSACVLVSAGRFFVHLALGFSLDLSSSVRLDVALLFFRGSHILSSSYTSFHHALALPVSSDADPSQTHYNQYNRNEMKRIAFGSIYFQVEYQTPWNLVVFHIQFWVLVRSKWVCKCVHVFTIAFKLHFGSDTSNPEMIFFRTISYTYIHLQCN